jgi:undecaprenyl-diphosphooligosaccharide---protein glycotransferase
MLSVREAQNVDWIPAHDPHRVHWSIFLAGICGYLLLIRKRPLPQSFFSPAHPGHFSFKLGNRFTMFGGPVIGLGFGFLDLGNTAPHASTP